MIITLLRKPVEGTVAENTLKHGCGAINIDATRIEGEPWKWGTQTDIKGGGFGSKRPSEGNILRKNVEGGFNGRWPANFILTHKEGCELKGTKKVKSGTAYQDNKTQKNYVYGGGGSFNPVNMKGEAGYAGEDGKEEVGDWGCVEGCPVKELDQQSGHLKSTIRPPTGKKMFKNTSDTSVKWNANNVMDTTQRGFNDEGGASRFFKQFKKGNDQ